MSRAHTPPSTRESLMRWLAAWLVVAMCAQALAIGTSALRGVVHRHGALAVSAQPMLLWRHGGDAVQKHGAHERAHALGESHQHALDDASVLGADAQAAALAALVSAPAPRAPGALSVAASSLRHVWTATELWWPSARAVAPPRHPPRA
jgi:hypothetical protein